MESEDKGRKTPAKAAQSRHSIQQSDSKRRDRERSSKKDPRAPKRFKSAYIFFSQHKFKEIQERLARDGVQGKAMNISSMVADAWRNTGPDERAVYVDMAEKDKARYEVEKSLYKGNWTVPKWQKDSHHTTAPRRPKSAFFAFSNKRRADVRKSMPTKATNGEVSRELSRLWREAPQHVKKPYIDEEKQLREQYLIDIAKWREVEAERMKERQESALKLAEKVNLIGGSRSNRVDPERSLVEIAKGAEASGRVMAPVTYGEKKRRGEFSFHELAQLPRQEQHADQKHPGLGSTEELLQQSKDLSIFPKSAPYAARPTSAGGSIAKKDSDESEKPELFSASELAWLDSDTIDNSSPTREISKNRRESQIFDSLSKVPGTVMEPSAARALLTLSESDSSPDSNQASPTVARDVSQGADLFLPFNPIDNSGGDGEYETMIPEPRKRDS